MEITDATALSQLAVRVGLLSEAQLEEAWEEADSRNPDPLALLRVLERKGILTPYQSAKLLKADTDGYFLGGYRLLYRISSGSFGRVFRADDPHSGRIVAIKVLRRRWSEDPQRIELFMREGRMGVTLKHPNLVEILAVSQDPASKQYFIVMEFVEGGNLREILQIRKTLGVAETLRILEDAASGLAYAFSRGVTHRDLKLTNLLISSQGTAKLVDFGLAQCFKSDEDKDKDKGKDKDKDKDKEGEKVERTVDYAGLEKATNCKSGDVRSDIFFLGCVVFETLTGRSPLEVTKDKNARMQKQRFDNVQSMRPGEIQAPASVYRLVENMMSLDPACRFQTPAQLLDAVRSARREVEAPSTVGDPSGTGGAGASAPAQVLFIVEGDERLQNGLREKFKEKGYRVLLAADPARARDRFRQQPYNFLIVDAGTTSEEGINTFNQIMADAEARSLKLAGIVILNENQTALASRVRQRPQTAVLARPGVTLKQLQLKLVELTGVKEPSRSQGQ